MSTRITDVYPSHSNYKEERLRGYAIEKALELVGVGDEPGSLITHAHFIENYIKNGVDDIAHKLIYADGVEEGRIQAKEAVEKWLEEYVNFDNLDNLFAELGWKVRTSTEDEASTGFTQLTPEEDADASYDEPEGEWSVRLYGDSTSSKDEEKDEEKDEPSIPFPTTVPDAILNIVSDAFASWLYGTKPPKEGGR